jgi:cell wall assembly regulator SMI1
VAPVRESWARIVDWLGRSAPGTAAQIGPPATGEAVGEVARVAGRELPGDLAQWWQLIDGAGDQLIPPAHVPLTIADALEIRRYWLDLHIRLGESIVDGYAGAPSRGFQSAFMPIAAGCAGRYLFVDLRDGPLHGCVAEWDQATSFDDAIHWPSVADMLVDVADALTYGVPALTFHAAGRLRYFTAHPEIPAQTYRAMVTPAGRLTWSASG